MEPLTPNTSAFLSYLSSNFDPNTNAFTTAETTKPNPTSLPPSAFFNMPLPGRDTPEDTPPSSMGAPSQSPEKNDVNVYRNLTPESADESSERDLSKERRKSDVTHKRKAGQGHLKHNEEDEDEDESASDFAGGHEDKRQHGNVKAQANGRKGARKSTGTLTPADEAGLSSKEKSARRKEQNRAAQKAFRERRENKVKDLEDKVAELEAKSFGTNVENENLRGILKRLQEENMALKQSAFTFSMPASGATGNNTPTTQSRPRPATPSHSNSEDALVSVHDAPPLPHRSSSTTSGLSVASPDSILSSGTASTSDNGSSVQWPKNLFDANFFNAFALGGGPSGSRVAPNATPQFDQVVPTPFSNSAPTPSGSSKVDVDALFAQLYPEGIDLVKSSGQSDMSQNTSPFGKVPAPLADSPSKSFNTTTYRDATAPAQPQNDWTDFNDSSMDDFLASLTGENSIDPTTADDDFDASIRQILGTTSPSEQFALPQTNPFSPTAYLNMPVSTPDSNSQSPGSAISFNNTASGSGSNATSPESGCENVLGSGFGTTGPPKAVGEHVYVVDKDGKVIKPSQLWTMMGMQHESEVEHLLIDDLCDQMKSKATCKDGVAYLSAEDAQHMFNTRGARLKPDELIDQRMRADQWM